MPVVAAYGMLAYKLASNTCSEATNKDFLFRTVLSVAKLKMRTK